MSKRVFLDNAATTPMAPEIIEMMYEMMQTNFANPSSVHSFGRESKIIVENARKTVADLLHTSPGNIFFTSGGTEADNMAIKCAINDHKITHAITAKLSHHAVLYPLEDLEKEGVIKLSFINIDENGVVDLNHLKELLENNPRTFVSIIHANNEIGTVADVAGIGKIAHENDVFFHTDAAQAVGHIPIDVNTMNIDLMSFSSHKIYGPKGIGALFVRSLKPRVKLDSIMFGGGQEQNIRSGTLNVPGIVGFGKAIEIARKDME